MDPKLGLYFGLIPTSVLAATLGITFVYFAATFSSRPPSDDPFFYQYYRWFVGPVTRVLQSVGVTPNHITAFSLLLALCAAAAIGLNQMMLGVWLFVAAASCDVMDGVLARAMNAQSEQGAFFDSFVDRAAEGIIFGGFAYLGQGSFLTWISMFAFGASFLVSYARARGQSLGVDASMGPMQRPARLVAVLFATFFAAIGQFVGTAGAIAFGQLSIVVVITAVALLSLFTAARRVNAIMTALGERQHTAKVVQSPTILDTNAVLNEAA